MDWQRLGFRMGAVFLLWMVISVAVINSTALAHAVETNPLLLLIYWLVMAGSVIYLIATVIFPFFRFVLENVRSKPK